MVNPVQTYAWGSRDGIAGLQGRPSAPEPEAELWMGAHSHSPSVIEVIGSEFTPLDAAITAEPLRFLGADVVARFGARLPFLLKVLSAAEPLSLQVHPDDVLAREGFDAEEAAGIERAAPNRSYRDPYAKPEILMALTDFEALLGFRPASQAAAALRALGVPRLAPVVEALESGRSTGQAFLMLVDWPSHERADLVSEVRKAAARVDDAHVAWVAWLAQRYPADPGVVGVALLNYVRLRPDEAVYIEPGQIHAYLRGTGIELLGGSDNTLRGGLTPKHVAVDELRRVLSIEPAPPSVLQPVSYPDGVERWPSPRPEFELCRLRPDGDTFELSRGGPAIFLCLDGKIELAVPDSKVTLAGGESAFLTADSVGATLTGSGVVICATVPTSRQEARPGS